MVKRIVSLLLVSAILISLSGAYAASYQSTQSFLNELDSAGLKYTNYGVDSDGDEWIVVKNYSNIYQTTLYYNFFFESDCDSVSILVWDIASINAGKNYALSVINALNNKWKRVKFVLDESDNTVSAQYDIYVDTATSGAITLKALLSMYQIIENDETYSALSQLQ